MSHCILNCIMHINKNSQLHYALQQNDLGIMNQKSLNQIITDLKTLVSFYFIQSKYMVSLSICITQAPVFVIDNYSIYLKGEY